MICGAAVKYMYSMYMYILLLYSIFGISMLNLWYFQCLGLVFLVQYFIYKNSDNFGFSSFSRLGSAFSDIEIIDFSIFVSKNEIYRYFGLRKREFR